MRVFNMAFWEGNTKDSDDFFWGSAAAQTGKAYFTRLQNYSPKLVTLVTKKSDSLISTTKYKEPDNTQICLRPVRTTANRSLSIAAKFSLPES